MVIFFYLIRDLKCKFRYIIFLKFKIKCLNFEINRKFKLIEKKQ